MVVPWSSPSSSCSHIEASPDPHLDPVHIRLWNTGDVLDQPWLIDCKNLLQHDHGRVFESNVIRKQIVSWQICLCMNTWSQAGDNRNGGKTIAFVILYYQDRPDSTLFGSYGRIHIGQINVSFFDFLHLIPISIEVQNVVLYCKSSNWCIKPGFTSWLWFWFYWSRLQFNPVHPKTWDIQPDPICCEQIASGNFTPGLTCPAYGRKYKDSYISGCRQQAWSSSPIYK